MKISEILNKDKQNALKSECKIKWVSDDPDIIRQAEAKGVTVAQLLRKRAKNKRGRINRQRRKAEAKKARLIEKENEGI